MRFIYLSIVFTAGLLLCSACRQKTRTDEFERTDSLLTAMAEYLTHNPQKADARLADLQRTVTDSAAWQLIQVFRATAHRLSGDTLGSNRMYDGVAAWCDRHPGHFAVEGRLWNHYGVRAFLRQDNDAAAACYERAISLFRQAGRPEDMVPIVLNLADSYQLGGKLPKAAEYYRYALYLCDSLKWNYHRVSTYTGLANVYMQMERFEQAHSNYDLAKKALDGENYANSLCYYISRGNCYYFENRYPEALDMFFSGRKMAAAHADRKNLMLCDGNIGEIYLMMDSLPQARAYIDRAVKNMRETGDSVSHVHYYMRSLQADLAIAEGRHSDADALLRFNIDSVLAGSPRYLLLHYYRLEHYAVRNGRWKLAYDCKAKHTAYADSLRNSKIQNNVLEMELRYQRDTTLLSQKLALADYETRNLRQKNYFYLFAAGTVLFALVCAGVLWLMRRRSRKRLEHQMRRITELRMDIVRNRVSPHYIFNVLGTILPKLRRYPELVQPMEMLIDVLRGNLLGSGKMTVTLRDEMALVRQFVGLYHYSKGPRPEVVWHVDEGLSEGEPVVPAMSLQIPVENALKHAFPQLDDSSRIDIVVNHSDNGLWLKVEDNGAGYNPGLMPHSDRSTGTGLRLLSQTIEICNRSNRVQASFSIVNHPAPAHGTCVTLYIPEGYSFSLTGGGGNFEKE